ncbi:TIR-like protein FxsC [Streptomyces sp. TLI_171]|uniref:TIR-like protein FxsC n=1 Tax=Streptomyces sp. TLI_171 TaxID=1938859 RepID=UPI000C19D075|nr:TIR-like protein FxsC [Streptomyces sp. TLI_171]RKE21840.1 FxsC-like protein [Streptomyces sp. TLI_171]
MPSHLTRALEVLRAAGVELTAEELLDVLWLAPRLPVGQDAPLAAHAHGGPAARPPAPPADRPAPPRPAEPPPAPVPHHPVHSAAEPAGSAAAPGRSRPERAGRVIRLPGVKALGDELRLGRALRPLNRRRPAAGTPVVDEAATVAAWAESGLPDVVLRSAVEPWLSCVLVVDDGVSMLLWQRLVEELEQLLARVGGFRTVRTLGLRSRPGHEVALAGAPFDPSSRTAPVASLADPTGRTLVLVVTDGVGRAWRDGGMLAALDRWAAAGPTAVLHTLPRRLWTGGALATAVRTVRAPGPGTPNTAWRVEGLHRYRTAPVPVVELTPAALADWASVLAGQGGEARLDLWQPREPRPEPAALPGRDDPTGLAGLDRFRAAASPGAYRLAAYFAAIAPLSIPVMRLVQDAIAEDRAVDTAMLAEVLLGGLMRPWSAETGEVPLTRRQFEFDPEVQHALTEAFPYTDLLGVRRAVTRRIEELVGRAPEFAAWMGGARATGQAVRGTSFATVRADRHPPEQAATAVPRLTGPVSVSHSGYDLRPYFFLSYAHTPRLNARDAADPDLWVAKLFQDLCEEILELTDVPAGHPIGFMDRSMHQGQDWAERLSRELANCRVFVPLYSPRYFKSEACGREWHLFSRRPVYQRRSGGERATGIVPALWVSMEHFRLPRVAAELQFDHDGFGPDYTAEGLYALMKIATYSSQYRTAVHRLAQRIVDVAEHTVIPTGQPADFASQPSAFEPPEPADLVRISVFSYRQSELPADRSGTWYGSRRTDWQPYRPDSVRPLAEDAADIARAMGFRPSIVEFEEESEHLLGAAGPAAPSVVLVDRWALLDTRRREALRRLDRRNIASVVFIEPWNRADGQSLQQERMLDGLGDSLLSTSRAARLRPSLREGGAAAGAPGSLEEFRGEMERAVMRAVTAFESQPAPRPRPEDQTT